MVMGILFRLGLVLTFFCAQNIKGTVESHETIWSLNQILVAKIFIQN
jgi:hypothetical protein